MRTLTKWLVCLAMCAGMLAQPMMCDEKVQYYSDIPPGHYLLGTEGKRPMLYLHPPVPLEDVLVEK